MTVSVTTSSKTYDGDGVTTIFPTEFVFNLPADIEVIERDLATGAETVKVNPTDYSVTGGGPGVPTAGNVVAVVAPPNTVSWTLNRIVPEVQETELPEAGPLPSASLEGMDDRQVMMVQQHSTELGRTLTAPVTDPDGLNYALPPSTQRANQFVAFDAAGNVVAVPGSGGGYIDPLTTRGDVLRRGALVTERLPLGADGTAVVSNGTDTIYGQVGTAGIRDGAVTPEKLAAPATTSAFFGYLSAGQNNVTGDGTQYNIASYTEDYDKGDDFNPATGIFTAPVTGIYHLNAHATLFGLTAAGLITFKINVAGVEYQDQILTTGNTQMPMQVTTDVFMTAGQTALLQITATNQGGDTADLAGGPVRQTYFNGHFVS